MVGRHARRGNATLVFLIVLPVLLLVLLMVLHTGQLEQSRGEVQQVADAAALAAAQTLVDEATLLHDGGAAMLPLLERSREEARRFARANPVLGDPTELDLNEKNHDDGDIVFGMVEPPGTPFGADLAQHDQLHLINTVQINVVRSRDRQNALKLFGGHWLNGRSGDLTRSATALIDRQVAGFRQVGDRPIPVVPFALLSDLHDEDSWEQQVELGRGTDQYRYEREPYRVLHSEKEGDGLREMRVHLHGKKGDGKDDAVNCLLLHFGAQHGTDLARQIRAGLRKDDLKEVGGELVLGPDGKLPVTGSVLGPAPDSTEFMQVVAALQELSDLGEVRVWPLFHRHATEAHGQPILSGFVAARVMAVRGGEKGLHFVLQPACLSSATVVTSGQNESAPVMPRNPYICKVRLVN
jgi:hypothetical protein